MKRFALVALAALLLAAGQNAGNQMMTYADLAAYVSSGLFYTQNGQSVTSSQQMVTAAAYRTLILNSGTPDYADYQLIAYNDALNDSATPSPTPTPTATNGSATASPMTSATSTPTTSPTSRPTAKPTLNPTAPPKQPIVPSN